MWLIISRAHDNYLQYERSNSLENNNTRGNFWNRAEVIIVRIGLSSSCSIVISSRIVTIIINLILISLTRHF